MISLKYLRLKKQDEKKTFCSKLNQKIIKKIN